MEFSELAAESSDEGPCGMLDHSLPILGVHRDRTYTGLFPVECVSESVRANNDMKRLARISLAAFEELGISYSISDTFIQGGGYPANFRNPYVPYFEQAAPGLVPVLLHMLIKQDDQDQGINTLYSPIGSGRCLCLVAQIIGDTIIPLVEPFFELNIESPEWRHREAATHALGSICAGPTWEKLTTFLGSAFKRMLKVLEEDSNKQVKYTAAWTFRQILEFQHRSPIEALVVAETICEQIVNFLISSMTEVPNVAEDACYAFYFLARCQHPYLQSILSSYSEKIVQSLCTAAHRNDAVQSGLRIAALEALIEVMWSATAPVLLNLIASFLFSLRHALDMSKPSRDEREVLIGCRSLQIITQRVRTSQQTQSDFMEHADDIMDVLLMVFECKISPAASKEAMVAVRSLVQVTGRDFEKYMPKFCKHWIDVLHNFPECEFYSITVDVMINICSALNKQILSYCDGIIPQLVEILLDADLCEDLRPPILSCFGELAVSIGADFYHYLRSAMHALQKSKISVLRVRDTETAALLKCGVLEAYCGIFRCFKHPSNAPDLSPYAAEIVDFLCLVCQTDMLVCTKFLNFVINS